LLRITPKRTAKGHRLYTEADIQLIKKVVSLLQRGIPISQAKAMLVNGAPEPELKTTISQPSQWNQYRSRLAKAIQEFDDQEIAALLDEVTNFFPVDITLRFLLLPLHQQLIEQVTQPLGLSHLQFFGGFLQGRLTARLSDSSETALKGTLALDDALELLLLGVLLKQLGIRVLRLAGNIPTTELAMLIAKQQLDGAVIRIPAIANDVQRQQLQTLAAESGQLIFCTGFHQAEADMLRRKGLMTLSGDAQQDALTIKDVLIGINE
jgi:DNA-binding transcriptional MerR regulator